MAQARFSIGIDLGTTNSALAFVPLDGEAESRVLPVRQWEARSRVAEHPALPSFLYLPEDAAATTAGERPSGGDWIVGRLARARAAETPGRVVHSAKSWLCHHAADRSAPFLPWGSDEIGHDRKISPVRAAALILDALRTAWNERFAGAGADFAFDAQEITVTVPASFDTVAQRLTLAAAADAGFPDTVRLLEEPQAAFYHWLEGHDFARDLAAGRRPAPDDGPRHVLVVDVGGGTSDFSLFRIRPDAVAGVPAIERVAVSEHILLGGDNIDLALAHRVEPRLAGDDERLPGAQWDALVARCRDLKEQVLANEGSADESFPVSIPGRGAGLIAGTRVARISRGDIETVVLDGFFPECAATDRPRQAFVALSEWGLPFAADGAVTRHLADFLRDRPRVDAVLFNGGALRPARLRRRLLEEIGKWQGGPPPLVLDNAEPDLAVARGAARFGRLRARKADRIEAGSAVAVFLAARRRTADDSRDRGPALVCILPHGAPPEQAHVVDDLALDLRLNRPVRFQIYASPRRGRARAGDVVEWNERDFHPLPPLETVATAPSARGDRERDIPVTLTATINDLGLLQVACVSADPAVPGQWPLEFNLRPHEHGTGAGPDATGPRVQAEAGVDPEALGAARRRIADAFAAPPGRRDKLTAARLLAGLEKLLGKPRQDWNWVLVRTLWSTLEEATPSRATSVDHEETWLILAGFLLRPGFGAPMDDLRIDGLWRLRQAGPVFPGKRIKLQEYILWRRVAGGLAVERQEALLDAEIARIRQPKTPPELVLLAGSLERVGHDRKADLITRFVDRAAELARAGEHCAPYLAALGMLLNRSPLYAGPEAVVPVERVERAWEVFSGFDWADPRLAELQTLFLRAGRVVDNRRLDLPRGLRLRLAGRLEKCGVAPARTARLKGFVPVERSERLGLYGEALPPGLTLSGA
jgi:molecular chaperone DnaK (HSP70)